jgi:hypothetical protein
MSLFASWLSKMMMPSPKTTYILIQGLFRMLKS